MCETYVWNGQLYRGDHAVVVLNTADENADMSA
jgi:hypothetical protein